MIKLNFNVKNVLDKFKKSILCTENTSQEIKPEKDFFLSIPKNNDSNFSIEHTNVINKNQCDSEKNTFTGNFV